jgi:hypothetical protein
MKPYEGTYRLGFRDPAEAAATVLVVLSGMGLEVSLGIGVSFESVLACKYYYKPDLWGVT